MVLRALYAERVVVMLGDEVVADHPRQFQRDRIIYDPWHYLPVLMTQARRLAQRRAVQGLGSAGRADPGARQAEAARPTATASSSRYSPRFSIDGLGAVEAACAEALEAGIASGDVILTVLARRRQPAPPPSIHYSRRASPEAIEPAADCARYDRIRKIA